ncbi:YbhB/YbcL family Raf kinase inhibitor-like protein [Gordoniibacillus kamchatkensis]|uniref:YbhB/YbcL family Raf kinase inhibitor-like protein n=1 Tax=Gordoniibacillus kamchatkensis TaxID=1590651 RepID=UPI00069642C0|nr:YbhB/YbcL family Raf kinase inhibitor-like protein [Paenibacillus sp. VKM B-2647]
MKPIIKMFLFAAIAFSVLSPAPASAAEKDVMQNVASYLNWNTPFSIRIAGKTLAAKGEMVNSQQLIPVRAVFEAAGLAVTWDNEQQTWHADKNGLSVSQKLGGNTVTINGVQYRLDSAAVLGSDGVLSSARMIPLALGLELRWDSANRELSASQLPAQSHDGFRVSSAAFSPEGDIPTVYAHGGVSGGKNVSLPVQWQGAPQGTKSFAVIIYDIHPIADNFIHWSVLNIPATATGLPEGAAGHLQAGTELNAYYGMEPPRYSGDHLYRIAVFALDTETLQLPAKAPTFFEQLEPLLKKHALGYAQTEGFFRQ